MAEDETGVGANATLAGGPQTAIVVLAAGKGTRMRSSTPKVLHKIGGLSMLGHVLRAANALKPARTVVVVGHEADEVGAAAAASSPDAVIAVQEPQLGTGHAAQQARAGLTGFEGDVFILYGDTPMITSGTLRRMTEARRGGAAVVVLGFESAAPGAYGRLVEATPNVLERIVEAKDASPRELEITLCNSGVMCLDGARMFRWLDQIEPANAKGEYYLTDIAELARRDGAQASVVRCDETEVMGVNSKIELAQAEAAFQARSREAAMLSGVTLTAPETVFFAYDTQLAEDVVVEPHVVFGPGARIATGAQIRAFSHLEGCAVAAGAVVGPYARLRPGAAIGAGARVGNFVEVKNATLAEGAKANHLTYLGDAEIGAHANIGAGTITCNYDGYLKHRTKIGPEAFIGSNTALVAPVTVGARATVAAGSTITDDIPADALALARARQSTREGLARRLRETLQAAKATPKKSGG